MSDFSELEQRVITALERIGSGTRSLTSALKAAEDAGGKPDDAALAAVQEALEAERVANAQLEERVKAIREKQDGQVEQLETRVGDLTTRLKQAESELARLKQVNAQLRDNNAALRQANSQGLGDAHLINKSMQTELEALRILREADRTELDEIIGTLSPFVREEAHA